MSGRTLKEAAALAVVGIGFPVLAGAVVFALAVAVGCIVEWTLPWAMSDYGITGARAVAEVIWGVAQFLTLGFLIDEMSA